MTDEQVKPADRDQYGRFKQGNKAGGRKKMSVEEKTFIEQLKESAPEALSTLLEILKDKNAKTSDRLKASIFIIESAYSVRLKSEQQKDFEKAHNPFAFDFEL